MAEVSNIGKANGWMDVTIQMLGKPVTGARGVKYTGKQEKENVYGLGAKPIARSKGKKEYEASVTLIQNEVEALQRTLPRGKSLLDIAPFDVVVVYADVDGMLVTDILKGCEFTEVAKDIKVDDKFMEIELPLVVSDIDYNALGV